jgi:D-arabinose 1-dehydrogenase-like Zn-dependent alcohol dehydrogenase
LQTQCETTQIREHGTGAALFGYSELYGQVPGGHAEYLRVRADYSAIKVPQGPPDEQFLYLSDVLPTAWQAVEYAAIPDGGSVTQSAMEAHGSPFGKLAQTMAGFQLMQIAAVDRLNALYLAIDLRARSTCGPCA